MPRWTRSKEGVRNIWNTFSVVAALVAGLSVSILFADPFGSVGVEGYMSQIFVLTCGYSVLFCLKTIFYGIINLAYVEPLSDINVAKYLLMNPNTLGNTAIPTLVGLLLLLVAILEWIAAQYRYAIASTLTLFSIMLVASFCKYIWGKSKWDPDNEHKWMWPTREQAKRPRWVTWGKHVGFIKLVRKTIEWDQKHGRKIPLISRNDMNSWIEDARIELSRSSIIVLSDSELDDDDDIGAEQSDTLNRSGGEEQSDTVNSSGEEGQSDISSLPTENVNVGGNDDDDDDNE